MQNIWQPNLFISPLTLSAQPSIIISACLLGDKVRYDGEHKYQKKIVEALAPHVSFTKYCPENAAKLGTPRPAIRVTTTPEEATIAVTEVDNPAIDVTSQLTHSSQQFIQTSTHNNVFGCILKSRSPSCGLGSTPYYQHEAQSSKSRISGYGNGLFAEAFVSAFPDCPALDEEQLSEPYGLSLFLFAIYFAMDRDNLIKLSESDQSSSEEECLEEKVDLKILCHINGLLEKANLNHTLADTSPKKLLNQLLALPGSDKKVLLEQIYLKPIGVDVTS